MDVTKKSRKLEFADPKKYHYFQGSYQGSEEKSNIDQLRQSGELELGKISVRFDSEK